MPVLDHASSLRHNKLREEVRARSGARWQTKSPLAFKAALYEKPMR